jgi:hypothetical protein
MQWIDKIVLLFFLLLLVSLCLGCSIFQSNKKTKMIETPPYYQQQSQLQQSKDNFHSNIDESKIFHRSNDEVVNVKVFRDTELEKLQRESVELDKMKDYDMQPQATNTTTKKSWFSSWFSPNDNEQKNNKTAHNTPYLMSEKAKKINANLQ